MHPVSSTIIFLLKQSKNNYQQPSSSSSFINTSSIFISTITIIYYHHYILSSSPSSPPPPPSSPLQPPLSIFIIITTTINHLHHHSNRNLPLKPEWITCMFTSLQVMPNSFWKYLWPYKNCRIKASPLGINPSWKKHMYHKKVCVSRKSMCFEESMSLKEKYVFWGKYVSRGKVCVSRKSMCFEEKYVFRGKIWKNWQRNSKPIFSYKWLMVVNGHITI